MLSIVGPSSSNSSNSSSSSSSSKIMVSIPIGPRSDYILENIGQVPQRSTHEIPDKALISHSIMCLDYNV